jgi:N-acetylglucosaminyl-diphospho-decaprenol L-rhamnosyltransferase
VSRAVGLSVILVNFNDRAHLGACLGSVRAATEKLSAEVILVDNHSDDGSPGFVRKAFPWVELIVNDHNAGFAKANNAGIRASSGRFVLFLNTDTVVPADAFAALLAELDRRPEAGAIGPALVRGDSSLQVSFGKNIGFIAQLRQKLFLNPFYRISLRHSRRVRSVGWLSGACLLARRDAVGAAGLFDEEFFIYFEDIDLCRRIRSLGFELLYYPSVRVVHFGGATTAPRKLKSRLHYRESQLHYYEKHNPGLSLFLLKLYLRFSLAGASLSRAGTDEDREVLGRLRDRISGRR